MSFGFPSYLLVYFPSIRSHIDRYVSRKAVYPVYSSYFSEWLVNITVLFFSPLNLQLTRTNRKVAFVLSGLGLTYESRYLEEREIKGEEHVSLNPNGRIPTLIDHHNNDFVVW